MARTYNPAVIRHAETCGFPLNYDGLERAAHSLGQPLDVFTPYTDPIVKLPLWQSHFPWQIRDMVRRAERDLAAAKRQEARMRDANLWRTGGQVFRCASVQLTVELRRLNEQLSLALDAQVRGSVPMAAE